MKLQNDPIETVNNKMDERILLFLNGQTILTIATSNNNIPYCASCFYVFIEELNTIVFKSNEETRHIKEALTNNIVSGSILPDVLNKAKIKGIQLEGKFSRSQNGSLELAKKKYYLKYPMALAMKGALWMIVLDKVKMTDNTLGFGKKLSWERK